MFATFSNQKVPAVIVPVDVPSSSLEVIIPRAMRIGGKNSDTLN
jgi:hypothetical protein